jgi:glycosyltransferase involved in cell wall biosynthesis
VIILAVDPSARVGGAELSLLDVLEELQSRGHSVLLAAPANGNLLESAMARGIPTEVWDLPRSLRRVGRHTAPAVFLLAISGIVRALWSLFLIARRHHAQIIYSNGVKCHALSGVLRLFFGWHPVVWHARDFISNRGIGRLLFPLARFARIPVIANSQAVAREWHARKIPAVVIHNGFRPLPLRNIEKNCGCLQLLTAGIFSPWKGFDVVLCACSLLPESIEWLLTVCGGEIYETDGHQGERRRLEELAAMLGVAKRVKFTGMVENLEGHLDAADILLHGSIRPEPFGRVLAEAMLAQVPVIASLGGGVPEIVRAGIDGLLYPMGDARALCDAIRSLAEDVNGRRAMGRCARARILADFSLDEKIEQIEQILSYSAPIADEWGRTISSS